MCDINGEKKIESPLMVLHNGLMLGMILAELENNSIENKQRNNLFRRIDDFLVDFDIVLNINHKNLYRKVDEYQGIILKKISIENPGLYWSVYIGVNTVTYISYCSNKNVFSEDEILLFDEVLTSHGSSYTDLVNFISTHKKKDLINVDNRITYALEYFSILIKNMEIDDNVVFVAMPFSKKYLEYYIKYYKPALNKNGYLCIRAWGGIGYEVYSEYMRVLISRCGKMFADISKRNDNVMYEVGIAHGKNKHVYLVTSDNDYPSNLCDDVVISYQPENPGWEELAINDFTMWLLAEKIGRGMKKT